MRELLLRRGDARLRARYWRPVERIAQAAGRSADERCCAAFSPQTATRGSASSTASPTSGRRAVSRAGAGAGLRDAAALHRRAAAYRRAGAHDGSAARSTRKRAAPPARPNTFPITPTMLALHRRRAGAVLVSAVSRVPGGVRGQGPGHHGRGGRGPSRLRSRRRLGVRPSVSVAAPRRAVAIRRAARGVEHRGLRSEVPASSCAWRSTSPDITYIGSPNPSTFLRLLDILNERRDDAAAQRSRPDVRTGSRRSTPAARRSPRTPEAAARDAARAARAMPTLTFANVWPGIRLRHDVDGWELRHRARRLRAKLPAGDRGHGARLSVDRVPRHDRAGCRKRRRRPAAAASSFLRVRRAGRMGRRPPGIPDARRARGRQALLRPDHDRVRAVSLLHERPDRGHRTSSVARRCCGSSRRARA